MATTGWHMTSWQGVNLFRDYLLRFDWRVSSQSVENNSSTIYWWLTFGVDSPLSAAVTAWNDKEYKIIVDGIAYTGKVDIIATAAGTTLVSGYTEIPHNPDGTKTFSYSYELEWRISADSLSSKKSGSSTGELDIIKLEPSLISSPRNFTDEDNPTITYSNPAREGVTSLRACIASEDGSSVFIAYRDIDKNGSSYTFNFTDSERTQLQLLAQNSLTYPVRFYIESVISETTYHSYSPVTTLTIKADKPTITANVLDTNETTFNLTGDSNKMIRGVNTMLCQMEVTGHKHATIVERSITCGERTTTLSSAVFTNVETNLFTFRAKDSRGLVTTKNIYLPMVEYVKPTCNQNVVMVKESETATQAEITITGKYFNDNFGAADNTLKLESRRREDNGDWSEWADITILVSDISNGTYTATGNITGLDASGTYEFQSRVTDAAMTVESTTGTFTLLPVFDWSKNDFNFNVPVTIQGGLVHDYVVETGTEPMGSNGTWYWSKWKNGRAECYGCRNYGNMGISTAWGGLYKSSTFGQDLPSGLFATTPEAMHIQVRDTGTSSTTSGCWISSYMGWAPDETSTGGFAVVSPVSGTASQVYISFNIVGRWK